MIRMHVGGISVDQTSGAAVLLLQDEEDRSLAICIGLAEATSIAKELEGVQLPRPLTHDLFRSVLDNLGAKLVQVEVIDLRDNTYFAELLLRDAAGREQRVDSRPSDAIALAVRTEAPIFVHRQVLEKAHPEIKESPEPADKEGWKKLLEEMDPKDFGKYKM